MTDARVVTRRCCRCRDWPQEIRLPRTEGQAPPPDGATASADVVKVDQPLRRTMP
ncbi:hypothetical protein ACTMU2_26950 [Cupriavidus basilensis]